MKSRKYQFNNSIVTVKFGDITKSRAEVIVSSDDTDISMGGGVSMAILKSGGEAIMKDAQKKLPTQLGNVVVSTSGMLHFQKFIFHCITISYDSNSKYNNIAQDDSIDLQTYIIQRSVNKCFNLIHALELNSIAFPCIGAGVANFPMQKVAKVMAETISSNLRKTQKQIEVELYLYDRFNTMNEIDYIDFFENFAINSAIAKQDIDDSKSLVIDEINLDKDDHIESPQKSKMNHKVFISYAREDAEKVNIVRNFLDKNSIKYWIDKEKINSGENFKDVIIDAIDTSQVVLFFSSVNSNKSENVKRELANAAKRNKIVIPLLLDDARFAKSIQYDFPDVDQIDMKDISSGVKRLLESLKYHFSPKTHIS